MIIKRITFALLEKQSNDKNFTGIYYKKEVCFYALSKEHKRYLTFIYLLS